jgi:hypothetical protein
MTSENDYDECQCADCAANRVAAAARNFPAGTLFYIGKFKLGVYAAYNYYRCVTCGSDFPAIDGVIRCNGFIITDCPWHGTRSKRAAEVAA